MFNKYAAFVTILFLSCSICGAQTVQTAPAPTVVKRQPILSKWTTMEGMKFYYAGQKIKDLDELKTIAAPLNDAETNRLLKLSGDSNTSGIVFLVGGTAALIGGVVMAGSNYDNNSQTLNTTGQIGAGVGLLGFVADYIGIFKLAESHTSEYNAIQRYNAIVHGEDPISWKPSHSGIQTELLTLKF